jgi:hypothetical protein
MWITSQLPVTLAHELFCRENSLATQQSSNHDKWNFWVEFADQAVPEFIASDRKARLVIVVARPY